MIDSMRLLLLLGIAGSAVTLLGSGAAWWLDEERRLKRLMRRALGGEPDAVIVARGRNAAAGFRLKPQQAVVMWNGGADALLYQLRALLGAELIVDDQVVARVYKGETRRALEQIAGGARQVTLRLIFDNPRDPDFELDLWLPSDASRRNAAGPGPAIQEARRWLARADAILRRAAPPRVAAPALAEPQEAPPSAAAPPPPSPAPTPAPALVPARPQMRPQARPPWEDAPEEEVLADDGVQRRLL
ncbi:MAG: hypothetical protein IIZ63_02870 [Caulobacteraceae bacterium]|nr:hypothetical protein [Caulobacteraceae bacterium]